jgi:hypothetical protein
VLAPFHFLRPGVHPLGYVVGVVKVEVPATPPKPVRSAQKIGHGRIFRKMGPGDASESAGKTAEIGDMSQRIIGQNQLLILRLHLRQLLYPIE